MDLFIYLIMVVVLVSLLIGMYSTVQYYKIKKQTIQLEQDKIALEREKLEWNKKI